MPRAVLRLGLSLIILFILSTSTFQSLNFSILLKQRILLNVPRYGAGTEHIALVVGEERQEHLHLATGVREHKLLESIASRADEPLASLRDATGKDERLGVEDRGTDGQSLSEVPARAAVHFDGKLVALVKFNDNAIDWDQATEDRWFEELEARKKAVLDWVNKTVGKNSKLGEVDAMKEPFEKTATQKIRRFKYKNSHGDEPEKPKEK